MVSAWILFHTISSRSLWTGQGGAEWERAAAVWTGLVLSTRCSRGTRLLHLEVTVGRGSETDTVRGSKTTGPPDLTPLI